MIPKQLIHEIAYALVIAGAINWLSVALDGKDIVSEVIGKNKRIVYGLVGAAGVYLLVTYILKGCIETFNNWDEYRYSPWGQFKAVDFKTMPITGVFDQERVFAHCDKTEDCKCGNCDCKDCDC